MVIPIPPATQAELDATAARAAWQLKLLPMMAALLPLASVAFLVVSLIQTNRHS